MRRHKASEQWRELVHCLVYSSLPLLPDTGLASGRTTDKWSPQQQKTLGKGGTLAVKAPFLGLAILSNVRRHSSSLATLSEFVKSRRLFPKIMPGKTSSARLCLPSVVCKECHKRQVSLNFELIGD